MLAASSLISASILLAAGPSFLGRHDDRRQCLSAHLALSFEPLSAVHSWIGTNWGGCSNPKVDELSQRIFNTFDVEERDKLIAQVHEMTSADAVRVFIVSDLNPRALSPKLSGFVQAHSWFQDTTPVVFSN